MGCVFFRSIDPGDTEIRDDGMEVQNKMRVSILTKAILIDYPHSSFIKLCRKRMPHALVDLKRNTKSVAKLKVCTPKNLNFHRCGKTLVKAILRFVFQSAIVSKQNQ